MKKENFLKRAYKRTMYALKKVFTWCKRAFTGKKTAKLEKIEQGEELAETPRNLLLRAFFSKKTSLFALGIIVALFAFAFIAPLFVPLDLSYTDPLQQNAPPTYALRKVPSALKKEVLKIDGFSGFSVGLSQSGEVFVWGNAKDKLLKTDYKQIPERVKKETKFLSVGKDHVLALTQSGELVGWGDDSCGQYGYTPVLNALTTPSELKNGINPNEVKQLVCGYQTSALVRKDGKAWLWGNLNAVRNLSALSGLEGVEQIAFTNSTAVALLKDGRITTGGERAFTSAVSLREGTQSSLDAFLADKKATQITASNKCLALLLENGDLVVSGVFENGENELPKLETGEYFTSLDGGARHFVGVTNYGNAYAWGHNAYKQCNLKKDGKAVKAFAGSAQSYVVYKEGKLTQSVGLKGYIMGTDARGRDLFARIVHGGKTTLTIGLVAVLLSSAIAVIVGCVSGYFGGAVDILLMRVTEIFSAIPFLPFAMLLSQIIKYYNIGENTRIFIIMLILGALSWTGLARMIRGQVLAEREKEFVTAARAIGVKESRIAFRHILPNIVSVILVSMTLDFAGCLLIESSLSYLGFGVQQPQPTWGNMLNGCNNSTVIQNYWWQWLFPSLFLSLATVCINLVGDNLRDALDPKSRIR